jgi:RNA polymerase sigma-70 factor (ECF subfamily)
MDLGSLYESFEPPLFRIALRYTRNSEAAEELVQDAFVKAMANGMLFDQLSLPQRRKWLMQTVRNLAIDRARARMRSEAFVNQEPKPVCRHGEVLWGKLVAGEVLQSLSERDREIVEMNHLLGMTTEEIGEALSMPHATVRSRLHLIFKKLRKQYEGVYNEK